MKKKQYPLHHDHGTVTIARDVFESMTAELERLRPMECGLELAEADRDAYKKKVEQLKAEVDELSFDKKLLENHWESEKIRCEAASRERFELSNENAKLVSKIESLKVGHRQGIANIKSYYKAKLESMQASMYADVVDAGMENRRLKRALWMARAERALEKIAWFKLWNTNISTMNPEDGARQEYDKWKKNLGKFLAKAEAYK